METIIGAGLSAFVIYAASKWSKNDKEKIQHTFQNIGYTVGDHEPKLFKKHKSDTYTLYSYHVPYGLIDDDKLNVLEKTLNKPVSVSFAKGKLHIKVYKNNLPRRLKYNWQPTNDWTIPIGQNHSKTMLHSFDEIPHMTIAGMTRHGKTALLKLIFSHLIHSHPDDAEFYIIDLKGGLEFSKYEKLKQVKQVASDVSEAQDTILDVLKSIEGDYTYFRQNGYTNILDTNISKRKFIIVDEGAQLVPPSHLDKDEKKPYKYCQYALSEIARISGALGYRLIFATQYPTSDTLPREIKQNADAKITFRLPTEVASRVAIDEQGAEDIEQVGRAIYRSTHKETLQVPYVSDNEILERLSDYVSTTGAQTGERRTNTIEIG
ncbi:cell division protein FtsK [Lentibacillus kapialis]|uniref:Cell division protein FtsK n=1 Tax=Lentibacillus kapialis TaxID=340214 RepID=A0A917PPD1_9BACI|nr:FtsK/SpoIIIE domain-containing protein [Lentibacillus kapialis]GGJ85858.1 cell division protein FtsK [Lentibacillus kapialis]